MLHSIIMRMSRIYCEVKNMRIKAFFLSLVNMHILTIYCTSTCTYIRILVHAPLYAVRLQYMRWTRVHYYILGDYINLHSCTY